VVTKRDPALCRRTSVHVRALRLDNNERVARSYNPKGGASRGSLPRTMESFLAVIKSGRKGEKGRTTLKECDHRPSSSHLG